MLILPLKAAVRFDLAKALGDWLDDDEQQVSFQPTNPLQIVLPKPAFRSADCRDDLIRLASLRNCLSDVFLKAGSHAAALDEGALPDGMEYHAALLQFERRGFPTLDDNDHQNGGLVLKWKAAFASSKEAHSNLLWDRACVTFNLVAMLTFQAAQCSVTDRDACKRGVGHCQQAASIVETLQELVQSQPDWATVDLSASMLQFWHTYLIAQGQAFVYRMASSGGNHTTLSSLAQSAFELFNDALSKSQDARLQSEVPQESQQWAAYCKTQAMMAAAKAEYHQAALQRKEGAYGVEIVRLRQSLEKLYACQEFIDSLSKKQTSDEKARQLVDYTERECRTIVPVVRDRLVEIERDNLKIYNEEVPKSVPSIPAKQLIKTGLGYPPAMLTVQIELFVGVS